MKHGNWMMGLATGFAALAAGGAQAQPTAAEQVWVAQVKVARGIVRIQREDQSFPAPVGTRLKVNDTVVTGGNGSVGMMFLDNSTLSLGPEGEVLLKRFSYDPTSYMGAFDAFVKRGAVALDAGNLAQGGNDNVRITTPQAQLTGNARQVLVNVEGK
jgi:hypothetical protein